MSTAIDIGNAMRAKALSFASKTGTAIDLAVVTAANAKHEFSLGPIKLYQAIKATLTEEEVQELPLPGSKWNEPAGTLNNNADICQWKDPAKPDGKAKEISFYVVWADGTPEGSNVVKELEWCGRIGKDNMRTDDIDKAWMARYASNPTLLGKRVKYLSSRRATVRKAYKDAVRLLWQVDMVNELAGCTAELDDSGEENTVIVSNKHKPKQEWKLYTVGAFLKLNPAEASESDGSYAALEATAKREPKTPETGGLKLNAVATPETSDKVAVVWDSYLDKCMSAKNGADYAALLKHLTGDSGKQAILTMGGIRDKLNALFKMDAISSRYDIEREKIAKAA